MPPLMNYNIIVLLISGGSFYLIGCLTWFFSTRRKTFVRTFVPSEEQHEVYRSLLRNEEFTRNMRLLAKLQMLVGILAVFAVFVVWIF